MRTAGWSGANAGYSNEIGDGWLKMREGGGWRGVEGWLLKSLCPT